MSHAVVIHSPPQVRNVLPPNFGVGAAAPSEYRDRRPCIQPPQRSTPQACMNFLEFNVHFRLEIKLTRKTGVSLPEVGRLSTGRLSSAQWRQTDSQIGYSITWLQLPAARLWNRSSLPRLNPCHFEAYHLRPVTGWGFSWRPRPDETKHRAFSPPVFLRLHEDELCRESSPADAVNSTVVNPLNSKSNSSATSNNMKLVHWPLMGGLLRLVLGGLGPRQSRLRNTKLTAHPSTASVLINVLLYDAPLLCGFNVAIKGLRTYFCVFNFSIKSCFLMFFLNSIMFFIVENIYNILTWPSEP